MKYATPLNLFKDLLKTNSTKPGRLLGLYGGDKYVGLAVSDRHNKIASPLSVLTKKTNLELMASDFQSLASEHSIERFVVAYPFDRHHDTPDAIHFKFLMDELFMKLEGIKYTYWDARFISEEVVLQIQHLDLHAVDARSIFYKFTAVEMLQGYLDFVNRKLKSETPESGDSIENK